MVKKFYNEEGANLMIPEEDMFVAEQPVPVITKYEVEERQRKIEEQRIRKEEKILAA